MDWVLWHRSLYDVTYKGRDAYVRPDPLLGKDIVPRRRAEGAIGGYKLLPKSLQPLDLPASERRKGGGRPVAPEARVRVRDPDSGALLGVGVAGELEISGPSLLHEYFGDAAATAAT